MAINPHTALLIALIALQVADAALTINIMRLGGRETLIGKLGRDAALVGIVAWNVRGIRGAAK